jgi:transcription factor-like protein/Zn(2)-Cys(6) binuclear cluster domain-containing protein
MPSRKAHEKNRHGCQQCKARRVKCDLQFPVCGNCERRSEPCSRDQVQIPARPLTSVVSPMTIPPVTSLPFLELELMHHFSTVVYQTLSEETVAQDLWQHEVPKEALQHAHLMHAILALSALHLQCSSDDAQQTAKYREPAIKHYDLCLSQLQLLVVKIDETNCSSVLAAAILLGFFSSVYARFEEDNSALLNDLWSNHQLLRGVPTIMEHAGPFFSKLKLSALVKPNPWDHVPIPAGFKHGTDTLRTNISAFGGGDGSKTDIYLSAVRLLEDNVKAEITNPQHITISYLFLPAADRRYMRLVAERDQMALVILAHYAIILHRQRHRWWMGENGIRLFGAVTSYLDADFEALVEWPKQFLLGHAGTQPLEAPLYYS